MSEFADKEVDELKRVSFSGRSIIHTTLAMVIPAKAINEMVRRRSNEMG